jgi:hypothetical protein
VSFVSCHLISLILVSDQRHVKFDFGHLLEFLQHLTKVKICPPNKELFLMSPSVELTFDLAVMKSLDTLVVSYTAVANGRPLSLTLSV